jgi:signal transduction histidine kinase
MEQLESDMTHVHNAGKKMQRLLDELLELSRVGRLETPHEEVQLQELVDETLLQLDGRIRETGVSIESNLNGAVFYGERLRISEVIQNLIDNAAKYMGDQAKPHITIGTETKNGELCCYVKDNGKGIDPKFQDTVFGLFEQLDKEIAGTGIGLAIVKRIIDVHGGRIWIDSEGEGRGSTFYFTLAQKAPSDDTTTRRI